MYYNPNSLDITKLRESELIGVHQNRRVAVLIDQQGKKYFSKRALFAQQASTNFLRREFDLLVNARESGVVPTPVYFDEDPLPHLILDYLETGEQKGFLVNGRHKSGNVRDLAEALAHGLIGFNQINLADKESLQLIPKIDVSIQGVFDLIREGVETGRILVFGRELIEDPEIPLFIKENKFLSSLMEIADWAEAKLLKVNNERQEGALKRFIVHGDLQAGYLNPFEGGQPWYGNVYIDLSGRRAVLVDFDWTFTTSNSAVGLGYDVGFFLLSSWGGNPEVSDRVWHSYRQALGMEDRHADGYIAVGILLAAIQRFIPRIVDYRRRGFDEKYVRMRLQRLKDVLATQMALLHKS